MSTPRQFVALLILNILSPAMFLLSGCGLINLQNLISSGTSSSSSSSSTTDFTGNYAFAGVPNSSGQAPTPVMAFLGAIANTDSQFTATFRLVTSNQCVSPTQDITFTGTRGSSGQINMTSTNLTTNSIAIAFLDDPTQSSNGIGTYTITGAGPCAMASTNFVSDQFSPVTGTYTGSFTSSSGVTANVTALLTQGAANADGQFPESGQFLLVTPNCSSSFTLTGLVTGPTLTASFTQPASGVLGGFAAILPDHAQTLTIATGVNVLGACSPGSYSGSLSKQ